MTGRLDQPLDGQLRRRSLGALLFSASVRRGALALSRALPPPGPLSRRVGQESKGCSGPLLGLPSGFGHAWQQTLFVPGRGQSCQC